MKGLKSVVKRKILIEFFVLNCMYVVTPSKWRRWSVVCWLHCLYHSKFT